jgi:hypothetical protein
MFLAHPAGAVVDQRAAVTAPKVGPDRPVSDVVRVPVAGRSTSVAFDGTNYLVVWQQSRGAGDLGSDIWAVRVTPSGTVLDPTGIAIAVTDDLEGEPAVAYGDGTFLVVWTSGGARPSEVVSARVSSAGVVLDPDGIRMGQVDGAPGGPTVAFGGGTFLVVWPGTGPTGQLQTLAATVAPSGDVGGVVGFGNRGWSLAISYGGGSFLVVWVEFNEAFTGSLISGTRISPAGVVLDPSGLAIEAGWGLPGNPAVAFNGTNYLVVWEGGDSDGQIHGKRVDQSGVVLDPVEISITTTVGARASGPSVIALGGRFVVGWYRSVAGGVLDAVGTRVDGAGTVLDPAGFTIAASILTAVQYGFEMVLSSNGSNIFAVWHADRSGVVGPHAGEVSAEGVPLRPGTLLARAADVQRQSAVASDGSNYLIVFNADRPANGGLVAVRQTAGGQLLDPSPIVLDGAGGDYQAVAFDGTSYLVTWSRGRQVLAVRVGRDGTRFGDPVALPARDLPINVGVASNGSGFLVTWNEYTVTGTSVVRAVRVSSGGSVLDPAGTELTSWGGSPSVASDGSGYLVSWLDASGVRAGRVGSDGSALDPGGFTVVGSERGRWTSTAWNGQRYLVVWDSGDDTSTAIRAARVTSAGVVQDPEGIDVATGTGTREEPVVAANGPFLVAWRERDGEAERDNGVFGVRVGDDGVVRDAAAFRIATTGLEPADLSAARGPGGTWAITYTRFASEAPYAADRVFLRTIAPK